MVPPQFTKTLRSFASSSTAQLLRLYSSTVTGAPVPAYRGYRPLGGKLLECIQNIATPAPLTNRQLSLAFRYPYFFPVIAFLISEKYFNTGVNHCQLFFAFFSQTIPVFHKVIGQRPFGCCNPSCVSGIIGSPANGASALVIG